MREFLKAAEIYPPLVMAAVAVVGYIFNLNFLIVAAIISLSLWLILIIYLKV